MDPISPDFHPKKPHSEPSETRLPHQGDNHAPNEQGPSISPALVEEAHKRALYSLYEENRGSPYVKTGLKQFANIHSSSILKGSPLEGAIVEQSLEYWMNLITLWESAKNLPVKPELTDKEIAKIRAALQDCIDFNQVLEKNKSEAVRDLFKEKLSSKQECFLPLSWSGSPGHFMLAKACLIGDVISIELLTKGSGAQFHSAVKSGIHKEKVSYKSPSFLFDSRLVFETNLGLAFFQHLLDMRIYLPGGNHYTNPFSSTDLYGLFQLMTETSKRTLPQSSIPSSTHIAITPQRSGNCADTGLRMALYEAVVDSHGDNAPLILKKSMYAFKLYSLLDGFRQFRTELEEGNPFTVPYMGHAVEQHLTRINKLYPEVLSQEEFLFGLAVGEEIQKQVARGKEIEFMRMKRLALPEIKPSPSLAPASSVKTAIKPITPEKLEKSSHFYFSHEISITRLPTFSKNELTPLNVVKTMEEWAATLKKSFKDSPRLSLQLFVQLYELFNLVPLATGEVKDPFWDSVPPTERTACVQNLSEIVQLALLLSPAEGYQAYFDAMVFKAYDIGCQLAPLIPELFIEQNANFDFPERQNPRSYFYDPSTAKVLSRAEENFYKRRNRTAHPRAPRIFSLSYDRTLAQLHPSQPEAKHYLERFFTTEVQNKIKSKYPRIKEGEVFKYFIRDSEQAYLPSAYYPLHNVAFLMHIREKLSNEEKKQVNLSISQGNLWKLSSYQGFDLSLSSFKMGHEFSRQAHDKPLWIPPSLKNSPALKKYFSSPWSSDENFILIKQRELIGHNESDIPKPVLEELALLSCSSETQISSSLDWASRNLHQLRHPAIQGCIELYLMQLNVLPKSLKNQHDLIADKIQNFLYSAINHYQEQKEDLPTLLWLCKIGCYLTRYIHQTPSEGNPIDLPLFYAILNKALEREENPENKIKILEHMKLSFIVYNEGELNEERIAELLQTHFVFTLLCNKPIFQELESESTRAHLIHSAQINHFLSTSGPSELNKLCNSILRKILPSEELKSDWSLSLSSTNWIATNDKYALNLNNFKAYKETILIQDFSSSVFHSPDYREVFGSKPFVGIQKHAFWHDAFDDNIRILGPIESLVIQRRWSVNGTPTWSQFVPNFAAMSPIVAPNAFKTSKYHLWCPCGNPTSPFIVNKSSGEFCYQYINASWMLLDPVTGTPTDTRIVDLLSAHTPQTDWKSFLSAIEPLEEVLLYEKKVSDDLWQLSKLEFTRLNLSFTSQEIDGKLRLKSDQYEGFYISSIHGTDLLHNVKGGLQFEDLSGKHLMVIFPAKKLRKSSKEKQADEYISHLVKPAKPSGNPDLDPALYFDHESLIKTDDKPYFTFFLSSTEGLSKPDSPKAALYLSLLYRAKKEYTTALSYLSMSEHMEATSSVEWDIVNALVLQTPLHMSPSQAAFDLHLGLRMQAQSQKYTKAHFKPQTETQTLQEVKQAFRSFIEKQVDSYSSFFSDLKEGISSIPAELRLTANEEKSLIHQSLLSSPSNIKACLRALNPPELPADLEGWDLISKVGEGREESYLQPIITRLIAAIDHSAFAYLTNHFFSLYEIARSSDSVEREIFKWNLFFLSQNDSVEPKKVAALTGILALVADHPSEFKKATLEPQQQFRALFSNDRLKNESRENAFKEVLKTCVSIQRPVKSFGSDTPLTPKPSYASFTKTQTPPLTPVSVSLSGQLTTLKTSESSPLHALFDTYFSIEKVRSFESAPFPLEEFSTSSPLAQKMLNELKEGHELNKTSLERNYSLKDSDLTPHLQADLSRALSFQETRLKELSKEIEELANLLPASETSEHQTAKAKQLSKQNKRLTLQQPLISCFLTQDTHTLLDWNPYLTTSTVNALFIKMAELFTVGRHIKLVEDCILIAGRISQSRSTEEKSTLVERLGKILHAKTAYDIEEHPEYLVYEFATGMILRKDQIQLLDWIFKSLDQPVVKNLLFQFQAGGGKTKVLLPIIAFKLAQQGHLPILINHTPLYEVSKRDLDLSLNSAFKQRVELLEIDLGTDLTQDQAWAILNSLRLYRSNKKCLSVKAETIHALLLNRKKAYEASNPPLVEALNALLGFFKTDSCVALIDEAHLTLDSLQETNQATGKVSKLPEPYCQVLIDFILMLTGLNEELLVDTGLGKVSIQEKVRLLKNQQALLTEEDLLNIRPVLIEAFLKTSTIVAILSHPTISSRKINEHTLISEIRNYLEKIQEPSPLWLNQLHASEILHDRDLASALVLAKKYLYQLLPHTLHQIQGISYGESLDPGDFTCTPYHDKKPTSSKFQDVMVTAVLTIQNIFQSGIPLPGIRKLMEILINEHQRQKQDTLSPSTNTASQNLLKEWLPQNSISLEHIDLSDETLLKDLHSKLSSNLPAILFFLKTVALPQIDIFEEKIAIQPPEFLSAFEKSIAFTATPGPVELYPYQMQGKENSKLDPSFEASVLSTLCSSVNQKIYDVDFVSLDSLFEELYSEDPNAFVHITSLIDAGGVFRGQHNKEVVQAFLRFAEKKNIKKDGGIYKEDLKGSLAEGKLSLLQLEQETVKLTTLVGSDLPAALKQIGKTFSELTLLTLFGLEDTTGADYQQPDRGHALLSIGEGQTKTKTIQAAMRMRRLLIGQNAQTLSWIISKELSAQVPHQKHSPLRIQDLFIWMIENESKILEKALVMRAFQGIQFLIQKAAWDDILSLSSSEEQLHKYKAYRLGLVDTVAFDPYLTFGLSSLSETQTALRNYAINCYRKLGFEDTQLTHIPAENKEGIDLLIEQTQQLVSNITTGQASLAGEMLQQQEVEQEQTQEQLVEVTSSLTSLESATIPSYYPPIWAPDFLSEVYLKQSSSLYKKLSTALEMSFIPEDIVITNYFMQVAQTTSSLLLRPFKYLLVLKETDKAEKNYHYIPCTSADIRILFQLLDGKQESFELTKGSSTASLVFKHINPAKIKRKAILVDVDGNIVKNAVNTLGLSKEEIEDLFTSSDFIKRTTLLLFLNGKIRRISVLREIFSEASITDLDSVWKKIVSMKVGVSPVDHHMIPELKRVLKWHTSSSQPKSASIHVKKSSPFEPIKPNFKIERVSSPPSEEITAVTTSKTSFISKLFFWKK